MTRSFQALNAPPEALEKGGVEVLRAVIVDGGLHVSLQRAFDEPEAWGILLADIARHVSRVYESETNADQEDVLARIRELLVAELDQATDTGDTSAIS